MLWLTAELVRDCLRGVVREHHRLELERERCRALEYDDAVADIQQRLDALEALAAALRGTIPHLLGWRPEWE